jgi:hypothetical protein
MNPSDDKLLEIFREKYRNAGRKGEKTALLYRIESVLKEVSADSGQDVPTRDRLRAWLGEKNESPSGGSERILFAGLRRIYEEDHPSPPVAPAASISSNHSGTIADPEKLFMEALRIQAGLEEWKAPDKHGRYQEYHKEVDDQLDKYIALVGESTKESRTRVRKSIERLEEDKRSIFGAPEMRYPQKDSKEWRDLLANIGKSWNHDEQALLKLAKPVDLLRGSKFRILTPRVALKYYAILIFLKDYFELDLLEIDGIDITGNAVDRVNEGDEPDFLIAAAVTMLARAEGDADREIGASRYKFGFGCFYTHQRLAECNVEPASQPGESPLYYLDLATGELSARRICNRFQNFYHPEPVEDSATLFSNLKKLSQHGVSCAFSIWEPAATYYESRRVIQFPGIGLDPFIDHHPVGIFVHPNWRRGPGGEIGEVENAFYQLIEYAAALAETYGNRFLLNRLLKDEKFLREAAKSCGCEELFAETNAMK